MIPELGHMALIVALSIAIIQAFIPLYGAQTNNLVLMSIARPAALAQALPAHASQVRPRGRTSCGNKPCMATQAAQ